MKFTFSTRAAVHTPDADAAVAFYGDVLGLPIDSEDGHRFVQAGPLTMYVDPGALSQGLLLELVVEDVEAARVLLEAQGCTVLRWEGVGGACLIEDPFGLRFNLWQESAG